MKQIYLCGPIADRNDSQCKDWREFVKVNFNGNCLDPLRRDYRGVQIDRKLAKKIVDDDLVDITSSDGLIVYYDKPSVGTSMEIFFACQLGKPIVLVNHSGQEHLSPWLLNHVTAVEKDLYVAIKLLEALVNE